MAKLNAKGTYHSVPIHQPNQKFHFNETLYQYTTLPNGYKEGSRKILQKSQNPHSFCLKCWEK